MLLLYKNIKYKRLYNNLFLYILKLNNLKYYLNLLNIILIALIIIKLIYLL